MERINEHNAEFRVQAKNIHNTFPSLAYMEVEDGAPAVAGDLVLTDAAGSTIDVYKILIRETPLFPVRFPFVFEVGGRIPINIDWHVFPDGHCCIKSIPEEIFICKGGLSLAKFIEQEVRPYFYNQKHREMHGYFLHERSHGPQGNIEFFQDFFGTKDLQAILEDLLLIKNHAEPNRVDNCFCHSGKKYRKCHRDIYRKTRQYSDYELAQFINMLRKAILTQ